MTKIHNPAGLPVPTTYSHGIEVPSGSRTLYIAGQVGWNRDGTAVTGIVAQTRQALANLEAILRAAGMGLGNVVKTTVFLVDPADFPDFAKTRSEILQSVKPASTLVYVKQLIRPELLVEIEAVAVAD